MRAFTRACRGGVAFLTRLPVHTREDDWAAFATRPAVFPLVGLLVGVLAAAPLLAGGVLPGPTVAFGYLLAVGCLTGVHHVDGVADLGDAAAVHGDADRRRAVLKDTTTGVGALLAVGVVLAGLALGGLALASLPVAAGVAVAVGAEVGAKLAMAAVACLGQPSHEGMGSQFARGNDPVDLVVPSAVAVAIVIAVGVATATAAPGLALVGSVAGGCLPWLWARSHLGGVGGDVFGAANEVGRLTGLHLGVIAWTLS